MPGNGRRRVMKKGKIFCGRWADKEQLVDFTESAAVVMVLSERQKKGNTTAKKGKGTEIFTRKTDVYSSRCAQGKSIQDLTAVKTTCLAYTKNFIFPTTDKSNMFLRALV